MKKMKKFLKWLKAFHAFKNGGIYYWLFHYRPGNYDTWEEFKESIGLKK